MTTRTAALRALFEPLAIFAPDRRAALEELLELATVGERALAIFGSRKPSKGASAAGPATQAKRTRKRKAATSKPRPKTVAGTQNRPDGSPTLREVILEVLKHANKPLRLAEIESAVKARGYSSTSANFPKLLALNVTGMKTELRRVGRGVYGLA